MGNSVGILRRLAVQISGTQTTTKVTIQLRETNGRTRQEKTTNMYFIVILRTILQKAGIEIFFSKFEQNLLDLMQLAYDVLIKLE